MVELEGKKEEFVREDRLKVRFDFKRLSLQDN
jgi:hypothetical protein